MKQWLLGVLRIIAFIPIKTVEFIKFVLIDIPMAAGERDDKDRK